MEGLVSRLECRQCPHLGCDSLGKPKHRIQWCVVLGILVAILLFGSHLLLPQRMNLSLLGLPSNFTGPIDRLMEDTAQGKTGTVDESDRIELGERATGESADNVTTGERELGTSGESAVQVSTGGEILAEERVANTSNESKGRTAYVMLVHDLTPGVVAEVEHMASDLDARDVYIIYDEAEHPFSELSKFRGFDGGSFTSVGGLFGGVVVVNRERLSKISAWFYSAREHIQTLLVAFYRSVMENEPAYERVWFLESDVRCNGDYRRTFAKAENRDADFLGLWTVPKTGDRDMALIPWNWEYLQGIPLEDRWGAFLPVMRLSRRGLKSLSDSATRDVIGFCEVYIPTMVHEAGGVMGSLPDEMLAPGDYRYRPQMTQEEYESLRQDRAKDALYHPVLG